ncbi:MAG: helix-turn-helix domain-containing protein [Trueperaceae bacterium]
MKTKALKKAFKDSGMGIQELSKAVGMGNARLYTLLNEHVDEEVIRMDTLKRLAVVLAAKLDTTPRDLLRSFFKDDLAALDKKVKRLKLKN